MLVYQRLNFRSLLADLPAQRLQATIVSYGAGLNACERAEQWTQAPWVCMRDMYPIYIYMYVLYIEMVIVDYVYDHSGHYVHYDNSGHYDHYDQYIYIYMYIVMSWLWWLWWPWCWWWWWRWWSSYEFILIFLFIDTFLISAYIYTQCCRSFKLVPVYNHHGNLYLQWPP